MNTSISSGRTQTQNAKVAAVTLTIAAFLTLAMTHTAVSLAPLKILTLALATIAVWAFSDEMGIHKPLNRAAFVCFAVAAATRIQVALGVSPLLSARYYLLYAAFMLLAMLLWSVAFLHRQRELKVVGTLGLLATLLPIAAIIVGHLVVGVGAIVGVSSLLTATQDGNLTDMRFVVTVERIFGLWGYVTAWLLWRGHVSNSSSAGLDRWPRAA